MVRFLDVKVDVVFKEFFGDVTNKEVLENFINHMLDLTGDDVVEVEEFLDPRKMRVEIGKPTTFVDISVKTKAGERYVIEMQTYNHSGFDKRLLYYLSRDYSEQVDYIKTLREDEIKKKRIGWLNLPKVHIIAVIDFHRSKVKEDGILNGEGVTETYRFIPIKDKKNMHLFDHWKATLVDLKKFDSKPFDSLHKYREWWFHFLKNPTQLKEEEVRKMKEDPVFRMAIERLERLSLDPKTRRAYEESINEQRDISAIEDASLKEGEKIGIEKGRKEGRQEERFAIAKEMIKMGMTPEQVASATKLSTEAIEALGEGSKV